ncbi:MAG: NADPH-dependent FMN reductase [Nocardioides sp.]
MTSILTLSGSSRTGSLNTALLRVARRVAADLPVPVTTHRPPVTVSELPVFNADLAEHGLPRPPRLLEQAVAAADAVLIATPEYSGSIPGPLKNALDWLACPQSTQPLAAKPVAVMSASPSRFGAQAARAQVLDVLQRCDATLVAAPVVSIARAHTAIDSTGDFTSEHARTSVRALLYELVAAAETRPERSPVSTDQLPTRSAL